MRPLRICIVMPSHWSNTMGGAEYQARLLVDALQRQGDWEIHFLCRNANFAQQYPGMVLHDVGSKGPLARYAKFVDSRGLLGKLKAIAPDVIYQRNGGAYTGVCAYYAAKYRCRYIWHIAHEKDITPERGLLFSNPLKFLDKELLEYGIRKSDLIVAQTRDQQALIAHHYGKQADVVVGNFHPAPSVDGKTANANIQVLWVANFNPNKQPHCLLELAKRFSRDDGIEFTMVGRAPDNYRELVTAIEQQHNITYLGSKPIEEVNDLFASSDIFVNTSSQEGFPNTFIQAWMHRLPILSLEVNPDQVLTRESIGLCSGSIAEMETDLRGLVEHRQQREAMGEKARDYALQHHSLANAGALIDLLRDQAVA